MNGLRYVGNKMFFVFSALLLVSFISLFAAWIHINNRETVKSWLVEANSYDLVVDNSLELFLTSAQSKGEEGQISLEAAIEQSPLDKNKIVGIFKQVYDEPYLRSNSEEVIDGIYDWLEGKADRPVYDVSLGEKAPELADKLGSELKTELGALPQCSYEQLVNLQGEEFNPLTATCVPPGFDLNEQIDEFTGNLAKDNSALYSARLNSDELNLDPDAQTGVPRAFSFLNTLIIVIPVFLIVSGVLYVFTAKSRLEGLEKLGKKFFATGVVSFILFLVFYSTRAWFDKLDGTSPQATPEGTPIGFLQNVVGSLWRVAVGDVATTGMILSVATVCAAIGIWIGAWFAQKNQHPLEPKPKPAKTD